MNPTVAAAAIGVGGTVIVGVAGFSAAIWSAKQTIKHARESRIWDKRAEVYVDALAAITYRQDRLDRQTDPSRSTEQDKQDAQNNPGTSSEPQSWTDLEARLAAFASEPVIVAVQASSTAYRRFVQASGVRRALHAMPNAGETHNAIVAARDKEWRAAMDTTQDADLAVVKLIRTELQGKGQSPTD